MEFGPWNHSSVLQLLGLIKLDKHRIQHAEEKHWSLSHHWSIFYSKPPLSKCKVPARLCEDLRFGAMAEFGEASVTRTSTKPTSQQHAAERSYRYVRRMGMSWKIPLSVMKYECEDHSWLDVHYMSPQSTLQYLIDNHPRVVFGKPTLQEGMASVRAFWGGYAEFHKTHEVFLRNYSDIGRVVPVAIHGDEGKGKRRSQTTVISFEAVLGMKGVLDPCTSCCPSHLQTPERANSSTENPLVKKMQSNMKGHSFLQHWPMVVIPGVWAKEYKKMTDDFLQLFGDEFKTMFQDGFLVNGERWYCAVVSSKGDLKWISKICKLTRGYERKGIVKDCPCCHLCLAGTTALPAEDFTSHPCWLETCYIERPWDEQRPPSLIAVEFDRQKPEFMYRHDPFHTLRLGVFRDLVASTVILWAKWGLFGHQGTINQKLESAHMSFKLWCSATRRTASLRSFTTALFKYPNSKAYPYPFANVKGSDCTLLLKWEQTMAVGFLNDDQLNAEQRRVMSIILSTLSVAISLYDWLNDHTLFGGPCCAAVFYERGQSLINGYVWLADWAFKNTMCLYGIKPKMHFFKHMLLESKAQVDNNDRYAMNPVMNDCQQNEDLIGRLCKSSKKIDVRVMTKRVLEFYLVKAHILLKRFEQR